MANMIHLASGQGILLYSFISLHAILLFSFRYCNYVIMDLATQKIISYFVAIKHQVYKYKYEDCKNDIILYYQVSSGGSGAMEPYAAKTCLLSLVSDCQLQIASFTTDRSSTIKTMMRSDSLLSSIKHEYDPWHWISKLIIIIKSNEKNIFSHRECNERCVRCYQAKVLC